MDPAVDDRSCWTCGYQAIGGHLTFLGDCRWFVVHRDQVKKPIPPTVVDLGCKHWMVKEALLGRTNGQSNQA